MTDAKTTDLSKLRIDRGNASQKEPDTRGRSLVIILSLAALAGVAALLFFFREGLSSNVQVQTYTVTAISPNQADAVLTASGYVVAQRKAAVASKGTGRLVYLGVEEGDQVKAGQIIGRLEDDDVQALLTQAQANLKLARANLGNAQAENREAEINFERIKKLVQDQLVPQADYDAAEARHKRAVANVTAGEAAIAVAQATVRAAEVAVENTNIRAPFDGTVLTKNADVGEVVAPFGAATSARAAVVSIADMSSLEVEADVSESNIQRLKPGQPCEIVLDAYQDTRYPGVVSKIVPTADRAKATVMTKIKFVHRDERVLPEMSAKVTFLSKASAENTMTSAKKIVVSPAAIVTRGDQKIAFVVRDGSVTEMPVEIAGTLGSLLEVRNGLAEGNQVVLNPPENMTTGTKVKMAVK